MKKDRINTAIVGCGSFVKGMHLPNISLDNRYRIYAAVDIVGENAKYVFEQYNAAYFTTDYNKVLSDKEVDLVFITTRHDLHAEMSIKAAEAGKDIFCEKPMGLDYSECKEVMRAVRKNRVKYCIGYNRGLAPLITKAGEIVSKEGKPIIMYHRMQNYFAYGSHWLLDEKIGGGRIVGEGCHILDLFCVLSNSNPVRIYGEGGVFTNPDAEGTPDTGAIVLAFENGSVGTMLISSVGNDKIPKESTEIYCGDTAIIIENFQRMRLSIGNKQEDIVLDQVDKGHRIEMELLAKAILDGEILPNDVVSAMRAAVCSFKAVEAIKTHKVQQILPEEFANV